MAKLSVYKTIDRSQLGGKFVPLIHSGVNNYKILASDLGKEYSPGDAIEITDTGVINVNYDPSTLRLSSFGLGVRTDHSRGVFDGADGIYITSADSTIGVSVSGIKVNTESLIGPGLELHAGNMISVKTNAPLYTYDHGVSLSIGGDLYVTNEGALYVNSAAIRDSAKQHVYKYIGNSLSVDQGYLVVNTNYIASGFGLTTGYGEYGPISVDIEDVASAIGNNYIGSGLYFNNSTYTFSANVNTATGIIVKDNKLYLNSGDGLQTSNNAVSVKAADNTIYADHNGVRVGIKPSNFLYNGSSGLSFDYRTLATYLGSGNGLNSNGYSLSVQPADNSIDVSSSGIKVNLGYGLSSSSDLSGVSVEAADNSIQVTGEGVKVKIADNFLRKHSDGIYLDRVELSRWLAGSGLTARSAMLYVQSADYTIDVLDAGIKVNTGYGLSATSNGLYVQSADNSIGVTGDGIRVNVQSGGGIASGNQGLYIDSGALSIPTASLLVGSGLTVKGDRLYVKSADDSIDVSTGGIRVNAYSLAGFGISSIDGVTLNVDYTSFAGRGLTYTDSSLYVQSADGSIDVSTSGIKVDAGPGLETNEYGLSAKAANVTVDVSPDGISVPIRSDGGILAGSDGLYLDSGSISGWLAGDGLENKYNILYVKSADNTIGVSSDGIRVNAGYGLSAVHNGLYVKSADGSIDVSTSGIKVDAGPGLETMPIGLSVKSADGSIYVSDSGIGVDLRKAKYVGSGLTNSDGEVAVKSADGSIGVSVDGVKVNTVSGLLTHSNGLSVDYADICRELSGGSGNIRHASGDYFYASATVLAGEGLTASSSYDAVLNVYRGSGIDLTEYGAITVDIPYIANNVVSQIYGQGLKVVDSSSLYVKSADKSIDVSTNGIRVHVRSGGGILTGEQGLYLDSHSLPSANSLAGPGLGHRDGMLFNALYAGSGIKLENNCISVHVGSGLVTDGGGSLSVKPSHTINVSSDGVGVSVQSGGGILTGDGGVYIDSAQLAGKGLSANINANNVKLNVDPSALAGAGLEAHSNGTLYVRSADNFIDSYSSGVGLNVFNLYAHVEANSSNIERSNASLNAIVAKSDNGVKLTALYSGSGISIHNTGSIDVDTDNSTIKIGSNGLYVDPSALAGASLYVDSANKTLNVEYGDGLTTGTRELKVQAADTTISVGSGGISVNTVDLSHALAGNGLTASNAGLYVKSADNSLVVGPDGLYIDQGSGIYRDDSGLLCIKSRDGSIASTWDGLSVDLRNAAYIGAGLSKVSGDLEVKNADNSIAVTSDGIKVNPSAITGSGLVTTNGAIGVNVNTATGIIVKNNKLYLNAGLGFYTTSNTLNLHFADTSILGAGDSGIYLRYGYGFSADSNFCGLTLSGLGSNHTNLDLTAFSASNGYIYANTYKMAGSGLVASKNSNEFRAHTLLNVKPADNSIVVSMHGIRVKTYDNTGVFVGNHGVYLKSADESIGLSTGGIKVNTSAIAGHGLISNASGKLDINCGPGLALDKTTGELRISAIANPNLGEGLIYHSDPTAKLFVKYTDNENACTVGCKLEVSDNIYTQAEVQLGDVAQMTDYGFIEEPGDSEPDAKDFITQRVNYLINNRIQPKTTLAPSGVISATLRHWNVYKILNDGNAIDLTSLVVQDGATAELWIVFGSTVPSVTWPSDLVWDTSAAPTFAANKLYCVALRNDGNRTIGSVEYAITPPTTITGDTDGYPSDIDTIPWIDTRVRNVIDTYTPNRVTLTGTTITEYFRNNTYYILNTTGSAITMSFTAQPGESCELWIDIHSSIPSITWPSGLVWATGSAPQFTANTRNCIVIRNDGSCTIANFAYKYTI